jgi:hypothetical protein
MHIRKLNNKDWKLIEESLEKKLSSWKGKLLSLEVGVAQFGFVQFTYAYVLFL